MLISRLCRLVILLFATFSIAAQDSIVITGSVKDYYTNKKLPYANVSIKDSYIGTTTNDFGKYQLIIPETFLPIELVAKYMGYHDTTILITKKRYRSTMFKLYPKSIDINEVTVKSEKNVVFGARDYQVLDYLLAVDRILLISYKNNLSKSVLVMTDLTGRTISAIPIRGKPIQLFMDCANKPMLICQSLPYIIHIKDTLLHLQRAYQDKFNRLVKPCVATFNDYLFYKYMGPFDLSLEYFAYNFVENEYNLFTRIDDKFQQELFVYDFNHLLESSGVKVLGYNNKYESFKQFSTQDLKEVFRFNMFHHPVYAPLYVYDSTILIFDHPNSVIQYYNILGECLDSMAIDYWENRGWVPLIIYDNIQKKFYTAIERNGIYTLHRINIETGLTEFVKRVEYSWIENPQIRDNTLYFIYRRKDKASAKYLYFEDLFNEN